MHHYFCPARGVRCMFSGADPSAPGEGREFWSVNVVTLDEGEGLDLTRLRILYWDGKGEDWEAGGREEAYPGGVSRESKRREIT